ncbi:tripartite tricarboxylate transporter TctB family protein [Virgibacillus necropolis]|uniref:tripartite tricarboxylate transporter TctB family protein n=1 Tax=Virgibacillus necropolis TaxID=163877 RepID=UPI00384BDDEC
MKYTQYIMPVFFISVSIIYFIMSINLPGAKLGSDPNTPRYFPMAIGVFLFIVSVIYLVNVWRKGEKENPEVSALFSKRTLFLITSTLILSIIYSVLFLRIGFLASTLIFFGALLFVVNGKKKWIANIVITVLFTFGTWYAFSELLSVSLP